MDSENALTELSSLELSSNLPIPPKFFDGTSRVAHKVIIKELGTETLVAQNRPYEIRFTEPVFVHSISMTANNFRDGAKVEFEVKLPNGKPRSSESKFEANQVVALFNQFVTSIKFKPPKKFIGTAHITDISLIGLAPEEFGEAAAQIGHISSLRAKIMEQCQERISKVEQIESTIDNLTLQQDEITTAVDELQKQQTQLESDQSLLTDKISTLKSDKQDTQQELVELAGRKESVESSLEEKQEEREQLNTEVVQRKNELRKLKSDINQFPSEISGFRTEGAQSATRYGILALLPITVIVYLAFSLFNNTALLSHIDNATELTAIISILLTRIPYVLVCWAIAYPAYRIAKILINEMINITQQRLNLSKISIVAQDVANSSSSGLPLTDEELFEARARVKMALLKEHLRSYFKEDSSFDFSSSKAETSTRDVAQKEPSSIDEPNEE